MNVNRRDRRDTGERRDAAQRTPRSGGRIVAQRGTGTPPPGPVRRTAGGVRSAGAEGPARRARTAPEPPAAGTGPRAEGTAALAVEPVVVRRTAAAASNRQSAARLTVAPPAPVLVPRAPFVALILAVVVGGVLGILVVNTKINENAIRLSRMQDQQATLDLRQQQLEDQITKAEAPGNLVARARKLGLVDSGPPAFIRLPDGRTIGVPQPAAGEPAVTSEQGAGG
ncbi:hypothetical protein ACFFWC_29455 [Plantactinospora siamensis]|uniref:Septum formation initiator n=1 Tax=Plantactinospora siamensis TaxID=555372 RepID=A0ABV6NZS9_9ACTN